MLNACATKTALKVNVWRLFDGLPVCALPACLYSLCLCAALPVRLPNWQKMCGAVRCPAYRLATPGARSAAREARPPENFRISMPCCLIPCRLLLLSLPWDGPPTAHRPHGAPRHASRASKKRPVWAATTAIACCWLLATAVGGALRAHGRLLGRASRARVSATPVAVSQPFIPVGVLPPP
jgi:hypothetical protein